jgi:hydroxyacid-oxoacid transhydrogenase
MDFRHLGAKKVLVVTDKTVLKLDAMKQVVEGLEREGIPYEVFSNTRVEPKDYS